MNRNDPNKLMKGALLAFVIAQLVYLFFFFTQFPESFSNAIHARYGALEIIASWLSTLTMLAYCVTCLGAVAQLVLRKHGFLLWFQISGAIALGGNFLVFVLRQFDYDYDYYGYYDYEGTYYWTLFIMALFWTVTWCMYFARSSRVFSYMGQDATYLRMAVFTKNVTPPDPWVERPPYPIYPPQPPQQMQQPPMQQPPAPQYPPAYPPEVPRVYPVEAPPLYPQQPGTQAGYAPPQPSAPVAPPAPSYPPVQTQNQPPVYPPQNQYPPYGQPPNQNYPTP